MGRNICYLCHEVIRVSFHVPDIIWKLVLHKSQKNYKVCERCFTRIADEKGIQWDNEIEFHSVSWITHIRNR